MKYHVYFHDDFDGMVSGLVMFDFMKSRGDGIASFNPINFTPNLKNNWAKFKFKEPFILLDFMYHPKAAWWFDHHETSFINQDWKEKYTDDETHAFDISYKSACSLVLAYLKKKYKYQASKNIQNLVRWGDLIDSAGYKNARQIVDRNGSGLKLMSFLDSLDRQNKKAHQKRIGNIIKQLSAKSINEIIKQPAIAKTIKEQLAKIKESKEAFKDSAVLSGGIVFIDNTIHDIHGSHFLAYYFYPKSFYSVSLSKYGGYYHISVGGNPWNRIKGSRVHIGDLMSKYGGGGHKNVGGLEKKSKEEILKIVAEIIKYLNDSKK